jgi:NAD(P)H-dependent FMN reductase
LEKKPLIYIILGSTRQGREGGKVGNWIHKEAMAREDFDVELIDLKDLKLPFFDEAVSPAYNKGVYALPEAKEWADKIGKADGYIFVCPEYNHSFPAVLKNAIDYVYHEWNNKPAAVVTYSAGQWGGIRASQQLRQVFIELQMTPIRNGIHIPAVWQQFDEEGKMKDEHTTKLVPTFFDQLIWWAKALMNARNS